MKPHDRTENDAIAGEFDRRSRRRDFAVRRIAFLELRETRLEAQILDESEGGLGVFVGRRSGLSEGLRIQVHLDGDPTRTAEIRYVHTMPHGGFHVGLMWE